MRGGVQLGFTTDPIFVYGLPIDFFYFEDFRWSFFGKITGQKQMNFTIQKDKIEKKRFLTLKDNAC